MILFTVSVIFVQIEALLLKFFTNYISLYKMKKLSVTNRLIKRLVRVS